MGQNLDNLRGLARQFGFGGLANRFQALGSRGPEGSADQLLARRRTLFDRRPVLAEAARQAIGARETEEATRNLELNTRELSAVTAGLRLLVNDTTLLEAAISGLQETINRQTAAEATIGTFADIVEDLATGKIDPREAQERLGVPIGAFNKLAEVVTTGQDMQGAFTFAETQALRRALTSGNPLLDSALRELAVQATSPGGKGFAQGI